MSFIDLPFISLFLHQKYLSLKHSRYIDVISQKLAQMKIIKQLINGPRE